MRARFAAMIQRRTVDTEDAHGNARVIWSDPEAVPVYGFAPGGSAEPRTVADERQTADLDMLSPSTYGLTGQDRVTFNGDLFEVIGAPQDYTTGPFGSRFGCVVKLRRITG